MGNKRTPPDNEQRQQILEQLDTTLLVEAAAGTGKTTSMVGRMVALIRAGKSNIDSMAALTFTRKAAAELRARFQIELEKAARESAAQERNRLVHALSHVEQCFIGTIHSFCARLLRERPIEAGVDLAFDEMDEAGDMRLRETAWSEYVAELFATESEVQAELKATGLEISQLRGGFMQFAEYPDVDQWPAPKVELAGLPDARAALASYLKHMETVIPAFPKDRGTDKLMSTYEQLVRLARNRDLSKEVDLLEVLAVCKPSVKVTQKCWPDGPKQGKQELVRWRTFAEQIALPCVQRWLEKRYALVIRVLSDAVKQYDRLRAESGHLNYQDLLLGAACLLRDKPEVRRYFGARFTHLLVDEFQDTDPIQAQVMMYLTATDPNEQRWRQCTPKPGSLFVVGDPKQSIYRFRRADIETYNQVKKIINASGGRVVCLTTNFRTSGALVNWGNGVFSDAFPARADRYSPAACPMLLGRHDGCAGELSGLKVLEVAKEHCQKDASIEYEADFIARYIRRALDEEWTVPRTRQELDNGASNTVVAGDRSEWKVEPLSEASR